MVFLGCGARCLFGVLGCCSILQMRRLCLCGFLLLVVCVLFALGLIAALLTLIAAAGCLVYAGGCGSMWLGVEV